MNASGKKEESSARRRITVQHSLRYIPAFPEHHREIRTLRECGPVEEAEEEREKKKKHVRLVFLEDARCCVKGPCIPLSLPDTHILRKGGGGEMEREKKRFFPAGFGGMVFDQGLRCGCAGCCYYKLLSRILYLRLGCISVIYNVYV